MPFPTSPACPPARQELAAQHEEQLRRQNERLRQAREQQQHLKEEVATPVQFPIPSVLSPRNSPFEAEPRNIPVRSENTKDPAQKWLRRR